MNDKDQNIYVIQYQLSGQQLRAFQEAFLELQEELIDMVLNESNFAEANQLINRIKSSL